MRLSVCYGRPTDPAAFDDYYANVHVPLARGIPGVVSFTTVKWEPLDPGDGPPPYYMVASLGFATDEDLDLALRSAEMAAATSDVTNFADGGATVFRAEEADWK